MERGTSSYLCDDMAMHLMFGAFCSKACSVTVIFKGSLNVYRLGLGTCGVSMRLGWCRQTC